MLLRNPFVLIGLLALAIPVAIHLLVRAPARQVPFPSLRFLRPSRMRALRRSLLSDPGLLALRLLILAVATLALADPLLMTACRQTRWNARLARAVIADARVADDTGFVPGPAPPAWLQSRIVAADLDEGIRRGLLWLESAPPARRELVIVSGFALGTLAPTTLADIPDGIGIRLVRAPAAQPARAAPDARIVWMGSGREVPAMRSGTVAVEGSVTAVHPPARTEARPLTLTEGPDGLHVPELHFTVLGAAGARHAARAAVQAVAAAGVAVDGAGERPLIVAIGRAGLERGPTTGSWMAQVANALARDAEIGMVAARIGAAGQPFERSLPLVRDRDGAPLVTAASRAGAPPAMVVEIWSPPTSPLVPLVMRRALAARTSLPRWVDLETAQVPDDTLRAWGRPAAAPTETAASLSDRRWFWIAVLALLALETAWRRSGSDRAGRAYEHAA